MQAAMTGFRALWAGISTAGMSVAFTVRRIHEGSLRASPSCILPLFQHNPAKVCPKKLQTGLFWSGLRLFLKTDPLVPVQFFVDRAWHLLHFCLFAAPSHYSCSQC